jgi:TRAP-type mannitol/chloroaromatic compound transport system permease small subunit
VKLGRAATGVQAAVDRVLLASGYLAGAIFFVLAIFIAYDVVARKWGVALGIPTTQVTDEISSYMLVLASTWGFAYTLWTDAHVRIDLLLPYFSRRLRAAADLLAYTAMAVFACVFAWRCWLLVFDSWETGITPSTYLLTPLWIPQFILAGGFSLLALTGVLMAAAIALGAKAPGGEPAGPVSIA